MIPRCAVKLIRRVLLRVSGTISKDEKNEQVLDKLQVERERGITVKAQTASLIYQHKNENYLLNLVDTPVSLGEQQISAREFHGVSFFFGGGGTCVM